MEAQYGLLPTPDNSKIQNELGLEFSDTVDAMDDMARQLIALGITK